MWPQYGNELLLQTSKQVDGAQDEESTRLLGPLSSNLVETVLQNLRADDLMSVAASSRRLRAIVKRPCVWEHITVRLCGDDVSSQLRHLRFAPSLGELHIGVGGLSSWAAEDVWNYNGPVPPVRKLRLQLSALGDALGSRVLERHGPSTTHLQLDLCGSLHEESRNNQELLQRLAEYKLESLAVRLDNIDDIIIFEQLPRIKAVEIDLQHLRIPGVIGNVTCELVMSVAARFIFRNANHVRTLLLPPHYAPVLSSAAVHCLKLRTLTCNWWTLGYLTRPSDHFRHLYFLQPDSWLRGTGMSLIIHYVCNAKQLLADVEDLRLLRNDLQDLPPVEEYGILLRACLHVILAACVCARIVFIQWTLPDCSNEQWSWVDTLVTNNLFQLRELRLGGNMISPKHLLALAQGCPNLEILDVRRTPPSMQRGTQKINGTTTQTFPGTRRMLDLTQELSPKLSIVFDDHGEHAYDWNFYLDQEKQGSPTLGEDWDGVVRTRCIEELPPRLTSYDVLFAHLVTSDQWVSAGEFTAPTSHHINFWRCATLDSFTSPFAMFDTIRGAFALGLVDCHGRETLIDERTGQSWMNALTSGPTLIRALRIKVALVPANERTLILHVLRRVGSSLERLDLDFRGQMESVHGWENILHTLSYTPNIRELALRGVFNGPKPVLSLLRGQLPALGRLDLRDCLSDQEKTFYVSLKTLLEERGNRLFALALPPLPIHGEMRMQIMNRVARFGNLRDITLHVREMPCIKWFTSLRRLEVHADGDELMDIRVLASLLSRTMRDMMVMLSRVTSFTLPADLFEQEIVQEAVVDVMSGLRRLHVVNEGRMSKMCIEGARCRNRALWNC